MTPRLLLLQIAALAFSLLGYLLLARAAFGTGSQVSLGQGATLASIAILYAWWLSPMAAATSGVRGALLALVVIDVLWVFLGQGVAGLALCALPLCPDFAPWGDVVRYGSVVFGAWAAWEARRSYRAMTGATQWAPAITALVIVVASFALQGTNTQLPPR